MRLLYSNLIIIRFDSLTDVDVESFVCRDNSTSQQLSFSVIMRLFHILGRWCPFHAYGLTIVGICVKGQMHLYDDLDSKCAYTCHLSNKTTRKSVLLSTHQVWLINVSMKQTLVWAWRLTLSGQCTFLS